MPLLLEPAARTDVGRRRNNEDAVFATHRLAAIADVVALPDAAPNWPRMA